MVQIRTLTPSEKRVIHIPNALIGFSRYGTFIEPENPTPHTVVNKVFPQAYDPVPVSQRLDLPQGAPARGRRRFNAALNCWERAPLPPLPPVVRPKSTPVPYSDTTGALYWIVCAQTGHRQRRIRAQTPARAQQFAADFARKSGFSPSSCKAVADV